MKIVLSPAKSLDFASKLPTNIFTQPYFLKQSATIQKTLKEKQPNELMQLMHISENLANLNWQRNQEWQIPFTTANARQAIFAFNGDVYSGLDAYSIPTNKINVLQNKVRILSGLYGVLKPLDLIQAYRLEMGTALPIDKHKNLYEFWKEAITKSLNDELTKDELFVNLASNEYFSAVDEKKLKVSVITPEFKDLKNGKLKVISFYAKKARGLMVRYIIDHDIETIEGLKQFNYDNYQLDSTLSKNNKLVFTR